MRKNSQYRGRKPLPAAQRRVTRCVRLPAAMDKKIEEHARMTSQTPTQVIEKGLILAGFGDEK